MDKLRKLYRRLSLSAQIIITIILVFTSFFILQLFLNSVFFRNFYIEREIASFEEKISDYTGQMQAATPEQYFDIMYNFTRENNAHSVVLDQNLRIVPSDYSEYSIDVHDTSTDSVYKLMILDNAIDYMLGDIIEAEALSSSDDLYSIFYLKHNDTLVYDQPCTHVSCVSITGSVVAVQKPANLNYMFEQTPLIQIETRNIYDNIVQLAPYQTDSGYRYLSDAGPVNTLVFIERLDNWHYVMTVIQIQEIDNIIGIVSSYQNYVYLTAVVIIILWSFRIGTVASTPIKNIERVAREIADLNFDVQAEEYKNRETSSLSNSINLISKNLNTTIDTINKKNMELVTLYKEQTKQVNLKKQLVSSISHELKTPLMIMQVTVQGIVDGVIPEEEKMNELHNLLDEINKSSLMIQDLLQIYRLEDEEKTLEFSQTNLSEIVEYFVNDFSNVMRNYNLTCLEDIEKDIYINAEDKLIKRVISNFITNAIKYTPDNGKIITKVFKQNNHAYFEIINTETTISSEHIKNIWLPFYRIENTLDDRQKSKGSGIGLYLVGEILKAHQYHFDIINTKEGVKAYFIAPLFNEKT